MNDSRESPLDRAAAGWWDRFNEERDALSFEWSRGWLHQIHQGTRRGCGTRRLGTGGSLHFASSDPESGRGDARKAARDGKGGADAREVLFDGWGPDLQLASSYLEEVRACAAAELGRTPTLWAGVQLFRQWVVHETEERCARDLRRGAWMEVRAEIPPNGTTRLRLAGESISSIAQREPASQLGRAIGRRLREAGSKPAEVSGIYPVVFAAGGCEALLHEIGHLFEGEASGSLAGRWKPSAAVAPPQVTIVDDPGRGGPSRGSYRFDDEGDSPRKVVMIDAGRVAERITCRHGCSPASSANSTGHGRRSSYRDLPMARMSCTILEAGDADPSDIIADTGRGILVERIGTGSLDPESGRVTLGVTEGSLIEKGHVTRPIVPSLLVSSVMELLARIEAVGSDLTFDHGATNCVKADQHLPVMVGLPTTRIGMIRVISPQS